MSAPAGYFVAPDANGEVWIWQANGEAPISIVAHRDFRDALTLWDYLVSDLPHEAAS